MKTYVIPSTTLLDFQMLFSINQLFDINFQKCEKKPMIDNSSYFNYNLNTLKLVIFQ